MAGGQSWGTSALQGWADTDQGFQALCSGISPFQGWDPGDLNTSWDSSATNTGVEVKLPVQGCFFRRGGGELTPNPV